MLASFIRHSLVSRWACFLNLLEIESTEAIYISFSPPGHLSKFVSMPTQVQWGWGYGFFRHLPGGQPGETASLASTPSYSSFSFYSDKTDGASEAWSAFSSSHTILLISSVFFCSFPSFFDTAEPPVPGWIIWMCWSVCVSFSMMRWTVCRCAQERLKVEMETCVSRMQEHRRGF